MFFFGNAGRIKRKETRRFCILSATPHHSQSAAGTPDSPRYGLMYRVMKLFLRGRVRTALDLEGHRLPEGTALYVSNHPSAIDYPQLVTLLWPRRIISIVNEYYMRRGFLKRFLEGIGMIPKKLFVDESAVILKARRTVKNGYSIYLAPEGRLSVEGENYPILSSTGGFARFLSVPLVILRIDGAYLNKPKWRSFFMNAPVRIRVKAVLSPEELKAMDPEEVSSLISRAISPDEASRRFERSQVYKKNNKAKGLSMLLYRCPFCGALYSLKEEGDALSCGSCGEKLVFDEHYLLKDNSKGFETLGDLYRALAERERQERPVLSCPVDVKLFRGEAILKGEGLCRLDPEGFSFEGQVAGEKRSFHLTTKQLKALPFSCGEEFESYFENEQYYFYPRTDRAQCARFGLLADIYCEGSL